MGTSEFHFVIQARMGSVRFPGKVVALFFGKPLLEFLILRLQTNFPNTPIIVVTSIDPENAAILEICSRLGVDVAQGDEYNVFSRYHKVAEARTLKHLIRLTADNPLVVPQIVRRCMEIHLQNNSDLTSTRQVASTGGIIRYVPKGLSVDIIKSQAIIKAALLNLSDFDKEHVIPIFYREQFNVSVVKDFQHRLKGNFSIDHPTDLNRLQSQFQNKNLDQLFWDQL